MITDEEVACIALALVQKAAPIDRDRDLVAQASARIQARVQHVLDQQRHRAVTSARGAAHKAAGADDEHDLDQLGESVRPDLEVVARDAARLGMDQVGMDEIDQLLSQANADAIEWAGARSGELVTQVSETTRQAVADLTAQALEEGWSNAVLADALDSSEVFGESRAEMIARTETAMADVQGSLIGWKASGVVAGKEWLLSEDACEDCQVYEGVAVPLDDDFPEGDPPLHPRCRCDVLPVLAEDDE